MLQLITAVKDYNKALRNVHKPCKMEQVKKPDLGEMFATRTRSPRASSLPRVRKAITGGGVVFSIPLHHLSVSLGDSVDSS